MRSSDGTRTSQTGEVSSLGSSDSWALAAGMSGLFYVRQWEALRAYVVPGFAYVRTKTTSEQSESIVEEYAGSGSFGLQYALGRRFGIFAEVGVEYSLLKSSGGPSAASPGPQTGSVTRSTTHMVVPRSGIGAIFYF